ncbi:extracellular solute-binding protein [Pyrococcus abyssi]|uniref:Sugar ABC transporter binding protein related n=1 Tax=Pyrococcus abyssi (strain GE5 / Orsay) TaxID=272844 RepID=Q9V283_PYRAB|nr:extracellular solute-binding protein [Pyrococcus abyssi]CAB49115.1 Extracellular solute binding protein, substrate unknown [Pyrococcus abyssi GE5]CCE69567.1 TPA: sugar ABC transporter binding protein related [Pyrococcus abyssi GE5]
MKARVLILVGLLLFAVIASGCIGGGQKTETQPSSTEIQLTGDFNKDVIEIGKVLEKNGINEVKFSAWGSGEANSVMRVYGIVNAAYEINKIWKENGINVKIVIPEDMIRYDQSFKDQYQEFLSKQPLGQAGDFFVNSYAFLPNLAEEGYILDITDYAKAYQSVLNDFYPSLLEAAKYKGRLYGLPQDTEARPLYIRKDVAKCVGLDVSTLPDKVKNGEFTWSDVYEWAKKAKEKGCAEWGLIHRKGSAHPDLIQFIFAFNGKLYDEKTGKLVLDVPAVYKWLYVEWKFAQDGLLPEDIMSWDWAKQIHPTVVTGKTLFFIGGTWHWTEWQAKKYYNGRSLKPEEVKEWFAYTLFPAGEKGDRPVTLSQPFIWMINSKAGQLNPKYDELKDVYHALAFLMLVKASDAEINAIHSVISAHLPVRKEAAKLIKDENWINKLKTLDLDLAPEVKENIKDIVESTVNPINVKFLADVSYMLEYTHLAPAHPKYPALADIFKEAVDKVLRGEMTPEEAVKFIEDKIKADVELSQNVEIVGEIPKDWTFPQG